MPNRYIRESAIESETVNSLSWQAEIFWRRLLNRADDFGRFTGNHSLLRALIFPLQLDRVRDSDISRLLAECEKAGLLFVYSVTGKQFLVLNKWEKGRAKKSEYPPPPADICELMQTFVYGCSHMSPTPTPTPTPTNKQAARARGGLPESLNTPAMTEAWDRWLVHWSSSFANGRPMPEQTAHAQLRELVAMGPVRAVAAIENSITKGGLRKAAEPFATKGANANNRTGNSRSFSQSQSYAGITDKG